MVINHLLTGMILQAANPFFSAIYRGPILPPFIPGLGAVNDLISLTREQHLEALESRITRLMPRLVSYTHVTSKQFKIDTKKMVCKPTGTVTRKVTPNLLIHHNLS